jgi:class 3 adenylate cyclase
VVTSHTALIADKERGKLYVGNVAELSVGSGDKANAGFITLAFDVENALKNLSTGYRQMAWVVSQNAIFSCLGSDGVLQGAPEVSAEDMTRLLSEDLGLYNIGGQSYYFVHLTPLQGLDVHIFFFTRAGEEFSLMRKLSDHFQDILGTISYQRRFVIAAGLFILLIGLLDLSKKITRPVVLMSEAARSVARGKLQDVVIPKFSLGKNNEVQQLSIAFSEMIEGLKEKERVKGVLDKVVSHDIASVILKGDVHLGGEDKVVTMFFADIRNFTHLTQNMPPHQVIELVNTCMTKLSHVISRHHGVIDKYIGDEVMVLFGAPVAHEDSAYQAVLCAKNVMQELNMWNEERAKCSLPAVTMGVGIHTGKVCAGNMGAEDRLNYTVIGSNVNLAARLCSKAPAGEIWLTHDTLAAPFVKDHVSVDDMGPIAFKGFDEPKNVYRVKEVKG